MSVLRIFLLTLFSAAGAGVAASIALHLETASTPRLLVAQEAAAPMVKAIDEVSEQTAPETKEPPTDDIEPARSETSEAADASSPQSEKTAPSGAVPTSSSIPETPPAPTLATPTPLEASLIETLARLAPSPQQAQPSPAVASQIEELEEKLQEMQQTSQQNRQTLTDALNRIEQNQLLQGLLNAQGVRTAPSPSSSSDAPAPPPLSAPLPEPLPETPVPEPAPGGRTEVRRDEGDHGLVIQVENEDIRKVLAALAEASGMNILPAPSVQGNISISLSGVDADTALTSILKASGYASRREGDIVYVGQPQEFQAMSHAYDHVGTRVYRPNYVTAQELQQLITPMLSTPMGRVSVSSPSKVDIPSDNVTTGGDDFAGSEVVVVFDYQEVLAQIDLLVEQLDRRPRQVAIEAIIMSVDLDDTLTFGVDFALLQDNENAALISGSPLNNVGDLNVGGGGGLKFGFLDSNLGLFIKALESIGETNVIASPRVLCLNKQRAEILIGEQLGYVSTTVTQTAATQTVEFLEVGTQLRIRPFISSDGMVRLEVHPELSDGNVEVQGNFTLPNKRVTQVTTNIMCRDGSTVVIGGLIRENLISTATQIPLLGSLPLIGAAFRDKTENIRRSEIIVLLTPRIICDELAAVEGAKAESLFRARQANYFDKMSFLGKRHYGRRYRQLAQSAWNAGDAHAALRYANLAIHFDPTNLEATGLREEIVQHSDEGDRSVHSRLKIGLAPWEHPHRDYSKFGYPWNPPPHETGEVVVEPGEVFDAGPPPVFPPGGAPHPPEPEIFMQESPPPLSDPVISLESPSSP